MHKRFEVSIEEKVMYMTLSRRVLIWLSVYDMNPSDKRVIYLNHYCDRCVFFWGVGGGEVVYPAYTVKRYHRFFIFRHTQLCVILDGYSLVDCQSN